MKHPTHDVLQGSSVISIVLVGPPASGKSTLRSLFSDYDVVGCDLESFHNSGSIDGGWKQHIVSTLSEAKESNRNVACIEGAISDEEVGFIEEKSSHTIVINVDVPDDDDRITRHVERELDNQNLDVVADETIAEIETDSFRRHHHEMPYPDHDVSISNTDSTSTKELSQRCGRLVAALDRDHDLSIPK